MGPLDLALAGSSIFGGVGDAIDSGTTAGKSGDLSKMRTKEWVSSTLVLGTGTVLSFIEKAVWPLLVAVGAVVLLTVLHEWHAKQSLPEPDNIIIGTFK